MNTIYRVLMCALLCCFPGAVSAAEYCSDFNLQCEKPTAGEMAQNAIRALYKPLDDFSISDRKRCNAYKEGIENLLKTAFPADWAGDELLKDAHARLEQLSKDAEQEKDKYHRAGFYDKVLKQISSDMWSILNPDAYDVRIKKYWASQPKAKLEVPEKFWELLKQEKVPPLPRAVDKSAYWELRMMDEPGDLKALQRNTDTALNQQDTWHKQQSESMAGQHEQERKDAYSAGADRQQMSNLGAGQARERQDNEGRLYAADRFARALETNYANEVKLAKTKQAQKNGDQYRLAMWQENFKFYYHLLEEIFAGKVDGPELVFNITAAEKFAREGVPEFYNMDRKPGIDALDQILTAIQGKTFALKKAGRWIPAQETYDLVCSASPLPDYVSLGLCLTKIGDKDDVAKVMERIIKYDPRGKAAYNKAKEWQASHCRYVQGYGLACQE